MSLFTGPLTITHLELGEWRRWQMAQNLVYEVGDKGSGKAIIVPSGFITDGASVPQFLWGFLPSWGKYSRAAVVHDYLYERLRTGLPHEYARERKDADAIFLEAMAVCEVSWPTRHLMWLAVRVFGRIKRRHM